MITDYKRARRDAAFLVEWAKNHPRVTASQRYLEALSVMNGHDSVNVFSMALLTDGRLPRLPDDSDDSSAVPETGA